MAIGLLIGKNAQAYDGAADEAEAILESLRALRHECHEELKHCDWTREAYHQACRAVRTIIHNLRTEASAIRDAKAEAADLMEQIAGPASYSEYGDA